MQFHKMQSPHLPHRGIYGDCWRTAVACVLDMHPLEVPHWMQLYPPKDAADTLRTPEREAAYQAFLRTKGLSSVDIPYNIGDEPLQVLWDGIAERHGADLVYLATGNSPTGPHTVIYCGRNLLWDPSPTDAGIVAPIQGYIWICHFIPLFSRYSGGVQLSLPLRPPSKLLQGSIPEDNDE